MFILMATVAAVLAAWMQCSLPNVPNSSGEPSSTGLAILSKAVCQRGVVNVLVILLAWISAHNIIYTYLDPIVANSGSGLGVGVVLLMFGFASTSGLAITAFIVDRALLPVSVINGTLLMIGRCLVSFSAGDQIALILGTITWGMGFGSAPTILQAALSRRAGGYADVAQGLFVTVFNAAVALDGALASILIGLDGVWSLPFVSAFVNSLALGLILIAPWVFRDAHDHCFLSRFRTVVARKGKGIFAIVSA